MGPSSSPPSCLAGLVLLVLRQMNYLFNITLLLAIFGGGLFGVSFAQDKPKSVFEEFNTLMSKYRQSPLVYLDFSKVAKSELMGTETNEKGKFYFAKELFRIDINSPTESSVIYDGKKVWIISYPSSKLGGEPTVTSEPFSGKSKQTHPLYSLLRSKKIEQAIKVNGKKIEGKSTVFSVDLLPKSDQFLDVKIVFDTSGNLNQVLYKDEVGNEIKIEIIKESLSSHVNKSLFTYDKSANKPVSKNKELKK